MWITSLLLGSLLILSGFGPANLVLERFRHPRNPFAQTPAPLYGSYHKGDYGHTAIRAFALDRVAAWTASPLQEERSK